MSYFKYGDVVSHDFEKGEWVVIKVEDSYTIDACKCFIIVTNQRETIAHAEEFFTLIRPTPEERALEKLGEDYL